MPKFNKLRTLLGNGDFDWVDQPIVCTIVKDYTFDATDETMLDIQGGGGVIMATKRLSGKVVSDDGYAQSTAVALKLIPIGSDYSVILFSDVNNVTSALIEYDNALDVPVAGDVLIRPEGSVDAGLGTWFRF